MDSSQNSAVIPPRDVTKNPYGTSKQQILKAAERLFAERGFACTTLRDVAAASAANTALVGYYFGSKNGLRKAVAELQIEKLNGLFDGLLTRGTDLTEHDFLSAIHRFMTFLREDELIHRLRLWSLADGGDFAHQMAQSLWNPFVSTFSTVLCRLNQTLSVEHAEVRALYIGGLLQKYADLRWAYLDVLDLKSHPDAILQHYEELTLAEVQRLVTMQDMPRRADLN